MPIGLECRESPPIRDIFKVRFDRQDQLRKSVFKAKFKMFSDKSRPQILYVEDHKDTRELVSVILDTNLFDVTTADTIVEGERLLQAKHFDLYLLDRWLPDGDGLELAKTIRQSDPLTPIVFMSAVAFAKDRMESLEAGAQAYLIKPVVPTELFDVISALVELDPTASTPLSLSVVY